jgi:hypothetical protein
MLVLRHILAVLCEVSYHERGIDIRGSTAWPPRSPDLNPLNFYSWGPLKAIVYAASIDNDETLHRRIVDARQTIHNHSSIFQRMLRSMMGRVEACVEIHGRHSEHLL